MSAVHPAEDVLALLGPDPGADEATVLASDGAVWLLVGTAYPGNVGFAIRTAEVSGADGIFIDSDLVGHGRHRALRASMHANRFFPVFWQSASQITSVARDAGKRIIAVEDTGSKAPWEIDLTGSILLVIGGEEKGICREILDSCDDVLRIPMAGFIPSYNLHAAMAAVAVERLRQMSDQTRGT
jgi:tRNA G18 (ribose-2'-O)-methylase SpoU